MTVHLFYKVQGEHSPLYDFFQKLKPLLISLESSIQSAQLVTTFENKPHL